MVQQQQAPADWGRVPVVAVQLVAAQVDRDVAKVTGYVCRLDYTTVGYLVRVLVRQGEFA